MANQEPAFTYERCIACGMCVTVCPVSALALSVVGKDDINTSFPTLTDRPCTGCGLCKKSCPMDAIAMEYI
ncbi:MAG: 4Fe-4S dicluster domain-containing protein [Eubacteriales bacterium]|jgi:formate hydrogenlyase subunit 6/NADH:ubiquinone oxidoreductase subunit I|nr:4Fe-4S dicluster domain-containing protein [Eubacteriales bacterium]